MDQPLYRSAANADMWWEREGMAPPATCDSAVSPCFHGCLAFLHSHSPPPPTTISSLTSPPLSLLSQQQPSLWDFSTIPKFQFPATAPSRWPVSLSGVCMAAARTVWFSFHLGCHRSTVSFSALNVSPLTQTITLMWGLDPCFSSPTCQGQVQAYKHSCISPKFLHPTEFWVVLYILFLWSDMPVCSQLAFCMHFCVWRCIPDVSMERDVLHVHLLLLHLVPFLSFIKTNCYASLSDVCLPQRV